LFCVFGFSSGCSYFSFHLRLFVSLALLRPAAAAAARGGPFHSFDFEDQCEPFVGIESTPAAARSAGEAGVVFVFLGQQRSVNSTRSMFCWSVDKSPFVSPWLAPRCPPTISQSQAWAAALLPAGEAAVSALHELTDGASGASEQNN